MLTRAHGNLLQADVEALVNSVNTEGFMGKGIALQFKKAYPTNFSFYERACRRGELVPGRMLVFETGSMLNPRYIINFPTKRKWRAKSKVADIKSGLVDLVDVVRTRNIRSIAIPPLGCGLGGLDWHEVRPLIVDAFEGLPDVNVQLFEPEGAPAPINMPIGTGRPTMTLARALLLTLMATYREMDYRLTLLEIQKLAYFLQEAGEPLRLRFVKHLYGPYAHNLNKVLERVEGHFIHGYGDRQAPDVEIRPEPDAIRNAREVVHNNPESTRRLERVADLIAGFETPYGMELIASVHWVATHEKPAAQTNEDIVRHIRLWNDRKSRMFRPQHIAVASERLREQGWIT